MTDFHGVLNDGETATPHVVTVRITPDAVVISGENRRPMTWPLATVRRHDSTREQLRLSPDKTSLARVTIHDPNREALATLKRHRSGRFGAWSGANKTALLVGVLVLVAVLPVVVAVAGLSMFSGPLARMTPPHYEDDLGKFYFEMITDQWPVCQAANQGDARIALDKLTTPLVTSSGVQFDIKVSVVRTDFPNAFAMPGGYVLVTDELIDLMDAPEELAGVLAHEIAHVERRHVMAAMIRQLGLALTVEVFLGGGSGAGQQLVLAGLDLSAFAHSRRAEAEADALAVVYLHDAGMDPAGLADFFDTIDQLSEREGLSAPDWFNSLTSTHPDTKKRAAAVREALVDEQGDYAPALSDAAWAALKAACPAEGTWRVDDADPGGDSDDASDPEIDAEISADTDAATGTETDAETGAETGADL